MRYPCMLLACDKGWVEREVERILAVFVGAKGVCFKYKRFHLYSILNCFASITWSVTYFRFQL